MMQSSSHGCQRCNKTFASPNYYGITNKNVEDSLTLEIFQVMISESKMFQENDCGNCAGLNAADKTSKLSKNPKIQSQIDEIINDVSTEVHTTPPEQKSSVDVLGEKALPLPPPDIIAEVIREKHLPKALPPETVADAL